VDDGARIYIEQINIAGNERTRDYVIRREFDFAEGDAYNRVLVDRVERRLRATGLFDQVAIIEQQGSGPDQVILLVQVQERRTGQVSFTAGYSTADGIMGEISLTEENFLGRGQYLRLAFSIGPNNRNYSISFTEPYFLGRRLPIGFDIYRRTSQGGAARPFDETQTGAQIRLGLPLTEALALQLSYKFLSQAISNVTNPMYQPPHMPAAPTTIVTSSIIYGLTYSTIDDPRDPTRGLYLRATQEVAGLGGNNAFLRSTVDARLYQPLGYNSPIIAAFRVQAGDIRGRNGQAVLPTDFFVLGGDNIRGFANAGFGPRQMAAPGIGLGGMQFWTVNAELRFPFPILPPDAGFRGAVFADAGTLTGVPASYAGLVFDGAELRASIGASIMWASPIGLLRLDFARVLRSATYDVTQAIRFSIGGEF
jgi:outer membrane protein insertion porin family